MELHKFQDLRMVSNYFFYLLASFLAFNTSIDREIKVKLKDVYISYFLIFSSYIKYYWE